MQNSRGYAVDSFTLEKLLAGHAPCNINSFIMLQENLKDQSDAVKKGSDTRQTGHVILTGNFWMKFLSPYPDVLS